MKALAVVLSLMFSTASSAGTITTFSDRAAFNTAVGTTTLEDFTDTSHFPIPNGSLSSTSSFGSLQAGDIEAGATYTTPVGEGLYFNIDQGGGFDGGFLDGFEPSDRDLTITYDPLVSAFGFDTNFLMPSFDITINFSSGASYTGSFSNISDMQFFGFQSSAADITSVVISGKDSFFGFAIDNHVFGGVPRPPTSANLRVSLSGPGTPVRSGSAVPVYLRLDNYGPDAAYPPVIEFTSSSSEGSISITAPSGWICEGEGTAFVCSSNGNLPRGTTRFAFQVTAPANPPGGFITLNASVSSDSVDPIPGNNSASFKLYVKPSATVIPTVRAPLN